MIEDDFYNCRNGNGNEHPSDTPNRTSNDHDHDGKKCIDFNPCRNHFEILSTLKKGKMLEEIQQSNHRIARTYEFSEIVGTDQVLGSNVIDSKKMVPLLRNDQIIQVIYQEKLPSTRHLVIVESANKEIITAFRTPK